MDTFFRSSKTALKKMATFYVCLRNNDIVLTLENLTSSASLLGFVSMAFKAENYQRKLETIENFSEMISDLSFELRRCELEWIRKRDETDSLPKPNYETFVAIRRR